MTPPVPSEGQSSFNTSYKYNRYATSGETINGNNACLCIDKQCPAYPFWNARKNGGQGPTPRKNTGVSPIRADSLPFQFLGEAQFTDSVKAEWKDQAVLGRSENYVVYAQTGNREISISLLFQATEDPGPDVLDKANWIRALAYPVYNGLILIPPPTVFLIFGRMFPSVRGIVMNPTIKWMEPFQVDPQHPESSLLVAYQAQVDFTLKVVNTRPMTFVEVSTNFDNFGGGDSPWQY